MSQVVSFVEETCWNGDELRQIRKQVIFVLRGFEPPLGLEDPVEFAADYGLFYDVDDEMLISILTEIHPGIQWGWFIYQKLIDHSGIFILEPERGRTVGSVRVRTGKRRVLPTDLLGANIMSWQQVQAFREKRDRERSKPTDQGTDSSGD